ncbi:4-hydroxythreonine-4-phosphate dehydrogenase PdxA [Rhodoferax sp.]|uniref:4-hydroxythreonine-4-phosphate dehydrogenase PdxA n=1 Tax=Rhodoferax sp. TaxID=50421 RepID=UPI0025FA14BD|nr:4-hydroxythreonine-4-phosphate dehydrogenase PdxA [Rhodoferax sp.]
MTHPPIAITLGDAAGIGPEIIARCYQRAPVLMRDCFVAGDVGAMRRASQLVGGAGLPLPVAVLAALGDLAHVPTGCIPVLQIGAPLAEVAYGQVSAAAGEFAGRCVVWAADSALRGDIAALVTAPLHKEAMSAAGAPYNAFPGHTELLQARAAKARGFTLAEMPVRMMLANHALRTVLVSIHVSLREALDAVTFDNVASTIRITRMALRSALNREPRIAVAGLNPHAGEGGLFGREEIEIIAPAINAVRSEGADVYGPIAPDTVFMRARDSDDHPGEFDVVVAMYHDQGLIPVKYLGVEQGVNVTLGLPLVRTSPDHGTAFDIAGRGVADCSSLMEAVEMAKRLVRVT